MDHNILQEYADLTFLALLLWREARGESKECRIAIGYSVLNRIASPSWGNTVMAVGFQPLQYSSLTHRADRQLTTWPKDNDKSWQECLQAAEDVLGGYAENPIDGADSFHDTSIQPPKWAKNFIKQIGRVKFYKVGK